MRPVVIHDPELQLSAIVDTESFTAWGPTMYGPSGQRLLGAWLETLPADPAGLPSDVALSWFVNWLDASGQMPGGDAAALQEAADGPPSPTDGEAVALADREAQNAGDEPPPPQPADTDPTLTDSGTDTLTDGSTAPPAEHSGIAGSDSEPAPAADDQPAAASAGPPAPAATTTSSCPTCGGTGVLTFDGEDGPVSQGCAICAGTGRVTVEA